MFKGGRQKKRENNGRLGDLIQVDERGEKGDNNTAILWSRLRWGHKSGLILNPWFPDLSAVMIGQNLMNESEGLDPTFLTISSSKKNVIWKLFIQLTSSLRTVLSIHPKVTGLLGLLRSHAKQYEQCLHGQCLYYRSLGMLKVDCIHF